MTSFECKHERGSMARTTEKSELVLSIKFKDRSGRLPRLVGEYRKHSLVRCEQEGGDPVDSFSRRRSISHFLAIQL